jgi:hypothetical protein
MHWKNPRSLCSQRINPQYPANVGPNENFIKKRRRNVP